MILLIISIRIATVMKRSFVLLVPKLQLHSDTSLSKETANIFYITLCIEAVIPITTLLEF